MVLLNQTSVVEVEFDTRKSNEQDIDGNHIGLNINRIQSTKQVSLSNYDVNISAGGQDLRKVFMGFFGSTNNETELNRVNSWASSDTDFGGNGNQLWVWIMVPVANAEMEIVNLGLAADSSSHRSPIDNSLSVPIITKILKPVDFCISQHSRCVSNLLGNQIIMAKPAGGPARREK
ncbi:hypothetical protein GOBAR_DD17709 [Gossypium barbadense]|nr:hypothetical protein GOBAR_DD17709 [Gossypium barbadense]